MCGVAVCTRQQQQQQAVSVHKQTSSGLTAQRACVRVSEAGRRATLPPNVNTGGRGQMIVFLSLCE